MGLLFQITVPRTEVVVGGGTGFGLSMGAMFGVGLPPVCLLSLTDLFNSVWFSQCGGIDNTD